MTPARADCAFFHVIDLPEGPTPGQWDFRETEREYHGGYDLKEKAVLEIGSATGSHAFWMEKQGARVTPLDLSPKHSWDLMPTPTQNQAEIETAMRAGIQRINNGWHYCRDKLGSGLKLQHGSIYNVPKKLGDFDIVTYGSVLLHVRDPIGAVQHGAARAKEAIIITDRLPTHLDEAKPLLEFMPKLGMEKPFGAWTWWWATPQLFINLLTVLGFKGFKVTKSKHLFTGTKRHIDLFTLVATR